MHEKTNKMSNKKNVKVILMTEPMDMINLNVLWNKWSLKDFYTFKNLHADTA